MLTFRQIWERALKVVVNFWGLDGYSMWEAGLCDPKFIPFHKVWGTRF